MIEAGEIRALDAALADARAAVERIGGAASDARNWLSYVGWSDAITDRALARRDEAEAEIAAIVDERNRLMEAPDHEAWARLVERARRLAGSDAAALILADAEAGSAGNIVGDALRDVGKEIGKALHGAADGAKNAIGPLPWWVWAAGAGVLLVALAPTVNALAARGKR